MNDGASIEVGTVGNEGIIGLSVFLGGESGPQEALPQIAGDAWRMRAEVFRREVQHLPVVQKLLQTYTLAVLNTLSQSMACNHSHPVEERTCRWLLMTQDRIGRDRFRLTQEFPSLMVGVRRPTVRMIAGTLQKSGLITYRRGETTVVDRSGLERASCECCGFIRQQFDAVSGNGAAEVACHLMS